MKLRALSILGLAACATTLAPAKVEAKAETAKVFNVRMVIAHDPAPKYYMDAMRRFATTVAKETHGGVKIQLVNTKQYGTIDQAEITDNVAQGKIEMSAATVSALGHIDSDFWAFELPYAFSSYQAIAQTIDGSFGKRLLEKLPKHHLRGLAYTYSGGYKVVCSNDRPLRKPEDFAGVRLLTHDPVNKAAFNHLGCIVKQGNYHTAQPLLEKHVVQAADMTYTRITENRIHTKYVNELDASVFLTTILMNEDFYQKLPTAYREVINRVAQDVAVEERARTIDETVKIRKQLRVRGYQIVQLTPAEKAAMRTAMMPVYDRVRGLFSNGTIEAMLANAGSAKKVATH